MRACVRSLAWCVYLYSHDRLSLTISVPGSSHQGCALPGTPLPHGPTHPDPLCMKHTLSSIDAKGQGRLGTLQWQSEFVYLFV
jgi:hypothetical protein